MEKTTPPCPLIVAGEEEEINPQNQTCTTLCSMNDRTGKHSVKGLRTDAQRTTANIHVGGVEKLLLSGVFILLLSTTEE